MSGSAGIYHLNGEPVDDEVLRRVVGRQSHRGPDGLGFWRTGSVGLGHCMLRTTAESFQETQPLANEDGSVVLTADARVDNREELAKQLDGKGVLLRTDTDAELILRSYETWGEHCAKRILGDFAFVIWDARRRRLFAARDVIGVRSFFYHFDGKRFCWSSLADALFEIPGISRDINVPLLGLYLLDRYEEQRETLLRGILRLRPAHYLLIQDGRLKEVEYWKIERTRSIRYRRDEEYAEHFLDLFRDAVRVRLRSHQPVGCLLSGGLDSSSIVCAAQSLNGAPAQGKLESFSFLYDGLPCDEREYIEAVVAHSGVKANYFQYDAGSNDLDFEKVREFPGCLYAPPLFSFAPAFREARRRGIRCMLDGVGGDEWFGSSFNHVAYHLRRGAPRQVWRALQDSASWRSGSALTFLLRAGLMALIPPRIKHVAKVFGRHFRAERVPSWINVTGLRKWNIEERLGAPVPSCRFSSPHQERIYSALKRGWSINVVLGTDAALFSCFALERRHPLLDRRLLEFLWAIPEAQFCRFPTSKALLRRAAGRILPETIRNRQTKAFFNCVADLELVGRQAGKVEQILRSSCLADLGLIHIGRFRQLFRRAKTGPDGLEMVCHHLIRWELWCREQNGGAYGPRRC